jgi:hypothetical protein
MLLDTVMAVGVISFGQPSLSLPLITAPVDITTAWVAAIDRISPTLHGTNVLAKTDELGNLSSRHPPLIVRVKQQQSFVLLVG